MKSGFVALVGRPNVGKSSLMNSLVGHKVAITTPRVQTTRNRLLGIHTYEGNQDQIVFVDLPGVLEPRDRLGHACLSLAREEARSADLLAFVVSGHIPPGKGDRDLADWLRHCCPSQRVCLVLNKSDLFKADNRPSYEALFESGRISHTFVVSAATGDGVADMRQELRSWLPEGPLHFPPEAITDRMLRFLVAELVREQVMLKTNEEVPHASAVYVDQFQEKQDIVRISARIIVESQSQKGIIVGKAGKRIKAIGTAARLEIEKLLDKKVYLNLRAKVSLGWRNQPNSLAQLGYGEGICDEAGQMRS